MTGVQTCALPILGLYLESLRARIIYKPKIISVIILKVKFLPVINGKNIDPETYRAINGVIKMPVKMAYFKNLFI